MSVKMNIDHDWSGKLLREIQVGLLEMVTDVHKRAVIASPKDTSALANSGTIKSTLGGYEIKFGNNQVPYARIHELGGRTGRNGSVNIRAKHYLGESADNVVRGNISKYFRIK